MKNRRREKAVRGGGNQKESVEPQSGRTDKLNRSRFFKTLAHNYPKTPPETMNLRPYLFIIKCFFLMNEEF